MKKILSIFIILSILLSSTSCAGSFCSHEFSPATCTLPETCSKCGKVQGEALGHSFATATCTLPETCSICETVQGEALGHSFAAATCTLPETCSICGTVQGEALGHSFNDATCTTPQICKICNIEEGDANGHDWNAASCTLPKTCKSCGAVEGSATGHKWKNASCVVPKTCSVCNITEGSAIGHNYKDGKCSMCGAVDIKAEQSSYATSAYASLLIAEATCELISDKINDAWYFAIYKADDYHIADKAMSNFSSYVVIEKNLVEEGVGSYLGIDATSDTYAGAAVLQSNEGALYVVDYAMTKKDAFKLIKDSLDLAKECISKLDSNYSSINAYSDLVSYYTAVSTYGEFCDSPSGSYSQLSSTLSTFRSNCANSRNRCSLILNP